MEVALDTVCLNHLLRSRTRRGPTARTATRTALDPHIEKGRLTIGLDSKGGILGEWMATCGEEVVKVLVTRWQPYGGLRSVEELGKIPAATTRKLRQLGFSDTVDRLLVKVAMSLADRTVVSDESDFWDPAREGKKTPLGDHSAPVPKILIGRLGVFPLPLKGLLQVLAKP